MKAFPFPKETVERLILEKGYDDVIKLKDNYVGRGYDKWCIGFIAPEVRCVVQFLLELAGETEAEGVELEDLVDVVSTMCSDSFGHDVIVYFPNYDKFAELYVNADTEEPADMSAAGDYLGSLIGEPRPTSVVNSITGSQINGSAFMIGHVSGEVKRA